jgi:hypothetical protein
MKTEVVDILHGSAFIDICKGDANNKRNRGI